MNNRVVGLDVLMVEGRAMILVYRQTYAGVTTAIYRRPTTASLRRVQEEQFELIERKRHGKDKSR